MTTSDVRVRRPKRHEALVQQMRDEAGFLTIRDVLLFAAALGSHRDRRSQFDESMEPIRYETLTEPEFASILLSMLAAAAAPDDPEILATKNLETAVRIFEEFACGGLDVLHEELALRGLPLDHLVVTLATDAVTGPPKGSDQPLEDLLRGGYDNS